MVAVSSDADLLHLSVNRMLLFADCMLDMQHHAMHGDKSATFKAACKGITLSLS